MNSSVESGYPEKDRLTSKRFVQDETIFVD